MVNILCLNSTKTDLAGQIYLSPNYFQFQRRIKSLVNQYVSLEKLNNRLEDLPIQFKNLQPRAWKSINWQNINQDQIIGIDLDVFLSIIVGAMDTEAPIRGYTQTSRQYLEKLHPQLARFVGGIAENGKLLELGLWEKEERQHTPALLKIYSQLTGKKIVPTVRNVRGYQPSNDPIYRSILSRTTPRCYRIRCNVSVFVANGAHNRRTPDSSRRELTLDEINHLTKFWGFGAWAFPKSSVVAIAHTLIHYTIRPKYSSRSSLFRTLHRMTKVLNWQSWSLTNKSSFIYTCTYTLHHLCAWNNSLTPKYLQQLFGEPPTPHRLRKYYLLGQAGEAGGEKRLNSKRIAPNP